MAERVKVYEETRKKALPVWVRVLPLLLLLTLLFYFLARHPASTSTATAHRPIAAPSATYPDLGTVHFDTDEATLTQQGKGTLQRAVVIMKSNPKVQLRLEGYTDSTGSVPHNASLSQQRAYAVADFLKGQGIAGSRLTGGGFGPANPADSNSTSFGKADNRRVELFSQR